MYRKNGFTILEMLISLTILMVVLGLTSQGILMVMRVQNTQDAAATAQAKLRRTMEVIEQMVRGSVMGGLSQGPYMSDHNGISFASLSGVSGYQVSALSSGEIEVYASDLDLTFFPSAQALLVDLNGNAQVLDVTTIIPKGPNRLGIRVNACSMPTFTKNMQLHAVEMLGFKFDSLAKEIEVIKGTTTAVPLAFDITDFSIKYIYLKEDGTTITLDAPVLVNGVPQKTAEDAGVAMVLKSLQLTMSTAAKSYSGKSVERTYTSVINIGDLAGDQALVNIKGIKKCI